MLNLIDVLGTFTHTSCLATPQTCQQVAAHHKRTFNMLMHRGRSSPATTTPQINMGGGVVCAPRKATIAKRPCLISASRSFEVRALLSDASDSGSKKPPASPGKGLEIRDYLSLCCGVVRCTAGEMRQQAPSRCQELKYVA